MSRPARAASPPLTTSPSPTPNSSASICPRRRTQHALPLSPQRQATLRDRRLPLRPHHGRAGPRPRRDSARSSSMPPLPRPRPRAAQPTSSKRWPSGTRTHPGLAPLERRIARRRRSCSPPASARNRLRRVLPLTHRQLHRRGREPPHRRRQRPSPRALAARVDDLRFASPVHPSARTTGPFTSPCAMVRRSTPTARSAPCRVPPSEPSSTEPVSQPRSATPSATRVTRAR